MIDAREFYFLRHGETDHNANKILHDPTDIPLNARGQEQARAVSSLVRTLPVRSICVSPLLRAQQTFQIACDGLQAPVTTVHSLRECSGEIWQELVSGENISEKTTQFIQRTMQGLQEALTLEGPVLIVAHGGVHYALSIVLQTTHERIINNCDLIHFQSEGSGWSARRL